MYINVYVSAYIYTYKWLHYLRTDFKMRIGLKMRIDLKMKLNGLSQDPLVNRIPDYLYS